MSIKNHHQSIYQEIKKYVTFINFSVIIKTSAVLMLLLFCTNSGKTATSEYSSEGFVSEISISNKLMAETGVPAGIKLREEIKIYSKYRFEDTGVLQKVKEKIMDHFDFQDNHQISSPCSGTI